jgi:hypothetical protein
MDAGRRLSVITLCVLASRRLTIQWSWRPTAQACGASFYVYPCGPQLTGSVELNRFAVAVAV